MAPRRSILTLTTGLALIFAAVPAATATAGPGAVDGEAASILATASTPAGQPVTVVTTTQTSTGPRFTTEVADTRSEALDLIGTALERPATADVDVSHTVSIASTTTSAPVSSASRRRANDSQRSRQWALTVLDAEKVWRKSTGRGTVVAVVDTGVRATHPDLKGQVLKGWDFVGSDRSPDDNNGHGTHVAGIIAAKANNKRGIAGLAPRSRILPVKVLNSAGAGNTVDVSRGIVYAVNKGADVINLSLAGEQTDGQLEAAIAYAVRRHVVVVAAAGNSGCAAPTSYPAAYPGVIGVGAANRSGNPASFSNCGPYVDVIAPGTGIRSTSIPRPSPYLGCSYGNDYCSLDGTSMASPFVAAAAAVVISRTHHRLGPKAVQQLLTTRATDVGAPGYDTAAGFGLLNVKRALAGR